MGFFGKTRFFGNKRMLKFLCLRGEEIELPLEQDTSFRQFMIAHGDRFPQTSSDGNSFFWSFIVDGKWLNTFENRHRLMTDYLKDGDTVHCSLWILGGPNHYAAFKNNLHV